MGNILIIDDEEYIRDVLSVRVQRLNHKAYSAGTIKQGAEMIKKAVFGNVGTKIYFRVGTEDAEFIEKDLEGVFDMNDIIGQANLNAYVKMLGGGLQLKPFSMNLGLDFNKINAEMKANEKLSENIRQLSRIKYGRDRELVEEEINQRA